MSKLNSTNQVITGTYSLYTDINNMAEMLNDTSLLMNTLPLLLSPNEHCSNLDSDRVAVDNNYNLRCYSMVRMLFDTSTSLDKQDILNSLLSIDFPSEMLDDNNCVIMNSSSTQVATLIDIVSDSYSVYQPSDLLNKILASKIKYSSRSHEKARHNFKELYKLIDFIKSHNINIGLLPKSNPYIITLRILSKAAYNSIKYRGYHKSFVIPRYILRQYKLNMPSKHSSKINLSNFTVFHVVEGKLLKTSFQYSDKEGFIRSSNDVVATTRIDSTSADDTDNDEDSDILYTAPPVEEVSTVDILSNAGEQFYDKFVDLQSKTVANVSDSTYQQMERLNKIYRDLLKVYNEGELTSGMFDNFCEEYYREFERLRQQRDSAYEQNAKLTKALIEKLFPVKFGVTPEQVNKLIGNSKSALRNLFTKMLDYVPTVWIEQVVAVMNSSNRKLELKQIRSDSRSSRAEIKTNIKSGVATIRIRNSDDLSEMLHEFCHYINDSVKSLNLLEKDCYVQHTDRDKTMYLQGYGKNEIFRESDFVMKYMGKDYLSATSHVSYNLVGLDNSFEILSTGYEYLFTDPHVLIKDKSVVTWLLGLIKLTAGTNNERNHIDLTKPLVKFDIMNFVGHSLMKILQRYADQYSIKLTNVVVNANKVEFIALYSNQSYYKYELEIDSNPVFMQVNGKRSTLIEFIDRVIRDKGRTQTGVIQQFREILYYDIEEYIRKNTNKYFKKDAQFNNEKAFNDFNALIYKMSRLTSGNNSSDHLEPVEFDSRFDEFEFVYIIKALPAHFIKVVISSSLLGDKASVVHIITYFKSTKSVINRSRFYGNQQYSTREVLKILPHTVDFSHLVDGLRWIMPQ